MSQHKVVTTLQNLRNGGALDDLYDAVANVVANVRAAGRPGEVTLKIKIAPLSKGDGNVLAFHDAVTMKLPKVERGTSVLYADENGELSRTDPRQPKLPELREVAQFKPAAAAATEGK